MEENTDKHPNKALPNKIWMYRKRARLGQKQVAYLMGHRSSAHVSHYELGLKRPALENAIRLEIILNIPVSFLFPEIRSRVHREIQARRQRLDRFSTRP